MVCSREHASSDAKCCRQFLEVIGGRAGSSAWRDFPSQRSYPSPPAQPETPETPPSPSDAGAHPVEKGRTPFAGAAPTATCRGNSSARCSPREFQSNFRASSRDSVPLRSAQLAGGERFLLLLPAHQGSRDELGADELPRAILGLGCQSLFLPASTAASAYAGAACCCGRPFTFPSGDSCRSRSVLALDAV